MPEDFPIHNHNLRKRLADDVQVIVRVCHGQSRQQGWYTDLKTGEPKQRNVGEMPMLVVSEVAEGMEGHRKNLKDDKLPTRPMIEVELADAIIRIADLAGFLGLDLGGAVADKLLFNTVRADHKVAARAAEGGKAY